MNDIRHRVGIKASIQDVYDATYQSPKLQSWWATSASGSEMVGSQIELVFPGFPNHIWKIVELSDNELVRLKLLSGPEPWHGSELRFEFQDSGEQVFVTLTHTTGTHTPDAAFQYFCTKWPLFLVSLKQFLETGQGMPFPNDIKIQHD
ncbi:MAG: SRPBCC domain-containing protein [Planctomycetaceae bacterium]|jgi:uncharacterized protein YndB with AHSA1/START domain|nr:SRPBCC domain-containing protein [bacterium]MDC0274146.1 SRPBCC domain-containing protein [Planctomycetaceae bacterium]MDG2390907.1 SRPBCC domain-containing protein [Planctomycetaceae bacterium]